MIWNKLCALIVFDHNVEIDFGHNRNEFLSHLSHSGT